MDRERLRGLMEKASALLPIVGRDGPDYAEVTGTGFQAMTMNPQAFAALNDLLPALPTLLARIDELEAELQSWKRDHQLEALRANRAEERFLRAEELLAPFGRLPVLLQRYKAFCRARAALAKDKP